MDSGAVLWCFFSVSLSFPSLSNTYIIQEAIQWYHTFMRPWVHSCHILKIGAENWKCTLGCCLIKTATRSTQYSSIVDQGAPNQNSHHGSFQQTHRGWIESFQVSAFAFLFQNLALWRLIHWADICAQLWGQKRVWGDIISRQGHRARNLRMNRD